MNKLTSQQQLAAVAAKRQKTAAAAPRDVATSARTASDAAELFPGLPRVEYRPDAAPEDALCFRYYNASERIHGRSMEDWLRPALSLGHALRPTGEDANGQPTFPRQPPWSDGTNSLENYQRRIRAAFELCGKLGIRHWAAWDRDLAPEGDTLEETQRHLEDSVDLCLELQQLQQRAGTSIRPLWLAADLHSHPRYCQGAATAPDAAVVAMAGAQVRRALQAAQRLSADCFLFWGGREGYATPLNTDPARELRGYARLLRMTAEYRDRLGYRGQLLLETTPRPAAPRSSDGGSSVSGSAVQCAHGPGPGSAAGPGQRRYDDCAAAAVCLLKQYGLDRHYKLSAPPGHQAVISTAYGMLGCVNATSCAFPPDLRDATILMKTVVEQGGVQPGGLLVGVPLRRESLDSRDHGRDVLAACVAVVDCYARALRAAVRIVADGAFSRNLQQRYLSFHNGFGARLSSGEATLEDCEDYARKHQHQQLLQQHGQAAAGAAGETLPDWCVQQGLQQGVPSSGGSSSGSNSGGRPEHWEALCGRYVDAVAVAHPSHE